MEISDLTSRTNVIVFWTILALALIFIYVWILYRNRRSASLRNSALEFSDELSISLQNVLGITIESRETILQSLLAYLEAGNRVNQKQSKAIFALDTKLIAKVFETDANARLLITDDKGIVNEELSRWMRLHRCLFVLSIER